MWRRNSERRNSKSVKVIYTDEMHDEMQIRYTRVPIYRYHGRKCPYYDDLYNEIRMILFGKDDGTIPKLYWQGMSKKFLQTNHYSTYYTQMIQPSPNSSGLPSV